MFINVTYKCKCYLKEKMFSIKKAKINCNEMEKCFRRYKEIP